MFWISGHIPVNKRRSRVAVNAEISINMCMLNSLIVTAALSLNILDTDTLVQWYWDCDTAYMQEQLSGQDLNSCLSVTEELQRRLFNNSRSDFMQWWEQNHRNQWLNRGYTKAAV